MRGRMILGGWPRAGIQQCPHGGLVLAIGFESDVRSEAGPAEWRGGVLGVPDPEVRATAQQFPDDRCSPANRGVMQGTGAGRIGRVDRESGAKAGCYDIESAT